MSAEPDSLERRCRALAETLGLCAAGGVAAVRPLAGGVSSDIAAVALPGGPVCMKFALPKLKVRADWHAPVHRNAAEYAWLEVASGVVPASVPRLHGRSEALHGFAMEYLEGDACRLWKTELLAGRVRPDEAAAVGDVLGRVHAASTATGFDPRPFRNRDDFDALRIEPYLRATAARHPALAPPLHTLADALHSSAEPHASAVLVHGDISPKNVLFRGEVPVLLDAECATMGDASFDVAFCLNHLVLKAVHRPEALAALMSSARALWHAYARRVDWEPAAPLEARTCALLPALMLARVDGKSPVEYLGDTERSRVRSVAAPLIATPPSRLADLLSTLSAALAGAEAAAAPTSATGAPS